MAAILILFAIAYQRVGIGKGAGILAFSEALYFSIVTFTTLGYGDIAPTNNPVGQALVALEVVMGVIGIAYFTALMMRRLL